MPFFMVDDQLHVNRKAQALIDLGAPGLAALGLWTLVGSQVQAQTGDGEVLASSWRLLGDMRLFNRLARTLVSVGLWEELNDAGWQFHDWWEIGYSSGAKVKARRARMKELKNPEIVEAIKARDGDKCRYCGRKVSWTDKVGDGGATYDHVIPGLARGVTNIVVACRKCNRTKAQRTPEQAGMKLLPPPFGPDAPDQLPDQLGLESELVQSASNLGAPLRARYGPGSTSGSSPGDEEAAAPGSGVVTAANGPAGRPPEVIVEGHTGSAWHNWHGPPPPNVDETRCPTHGLDLPCRDCTAGHYTEEASP